jgi:hypothetical protein
MKTLAITAALALLASPALAQTSAPHAYQLTNEDIAIIKTALMEAPIPGKYWTPTFARISQQEAAYQRPAPPTAAAPGDNKASFPAPAGRP